MSAPFSLVTWNLFQGIHNSSTRGRFVANPSIDSHLRELDADIMILPEMWHFNRPGDSWAAHFAESNGYDVHQWVSDRPSRTREHLLWRMVMLSRIPARPLEPYVFPQLARFGQRAMVQIELPDSGLRIGGVHLLGIHLVRRNPKAWLRERASFREAIEGLDVVAGDMNMWGPVVRIDARDMRSAASGRTFPAQRPHSQIDHVLISDRVQALASERLPNLGSDHRGFKVTLQPT